MVKEKKLIPTLILEKEDHYGHSTLYDMEILKFICSEPEQCIEIFKEDAEKKGLNKDNPHHSSINNNDSLVTMIWKSGRLTYHYEAELWEVI